MIALSVETIAGNVILLYAFPLLHIVSNILRNLFVNHYSESCVIVK